MITDDQRLRLRANEKRYRKKQRALGIKRPPRTEEQRLRYNQYQANRRALAKTEGRVAPGDDWKKNNPERVRANERERRLKNLESARAKDRAKQAKRRATHWGTINNRIWSILHRAVFFNSSRPSKYTAALGYLWADLHRHLESQFLVGMCWTNWGYAWELDHIRPVCEFKYTSLDDPLFRECWALSNLRPLWREENTAKGAKIL